MKRVYSIFVVFLLLLLTQGIRAQEEKVTNNLQDKQFTIDNCVNHFIMGKTVETKVGYQYWFVDRDFIDGRTLKMSVVGPDQATHAPHLHTQDEFFFVLEGSAMFYLNGDSTTGEAYASFYCPANSTHGIRNIGKGELKYLVIKKY